MKKWIAAMLTLTLAFALAASACAQRQARIFTDSLGREVEVDQEITRVAVTGPLAQIVVYALAPDDLAGLCSEWDAAALPYIVEEYRQMPVLGQLYGGKGDLNLEELLAAAPQVIIDVGEPKEGVAEELDALAEQTGIPVVHVSAYIESMDETYAMLGELLGREEEAKALGDYCKNTYDRVAQMMGSVQKANLLYITGEEGLGVIAKGSYHSSVIDLMANNLAVVESPSSKGIGNEVDMEQILTWNPDVIIFSGDSGYDSVMQDPSWQGVKAVADGAYYQAPVGPYNWMGFPPSVQRLLGMLWMGELLYPDAADYDLYEEVAAYFELFYHCELTQEQYDALMARSIGK